MLPRKVRQGLGHVLIGLVLALPFAVHAEQETKKPGIVEIVELVGVINDATPSVLSRAVETINENPRVSAVVLVVNSPGGGAVASAAAYEELSRLKVPVVGWCDHVCASGGMYILMAPSVKYIGVRSETVAGSIGVIAQIARFNRLLEWAKIDSETYVSGALKDTANPTRAARDEERKYIQAIVGDLAERFFGVVAKSRKITNWDEVKTGKIFSGEDAVKIGLADAVMSREAAIKKAKELSGKKTVFTREEMKRMSQAADEHTVYRIGGFDPKASQDNTTILVQAIKEAVDMAKEIRSGESARFEYRMPYHF